MSSDGDAGSEPILPDDSAGSSVSSRLQEEYDEVIKYAVVVPTFDPEQISMMLTDTQGNFGNSASGTGEQSQVKDQHIYVEREPDSDNVSTEEGTPSPPEPISSTPKPSANIFDEEREVVVIETEHETESEIDMDLQRMERVLDENCFELKRNVLAELATAKVKITERCKKWIYEERKKNNGEMEKVETEMKHLREILTTYEASMKKKDDVISNLTHALQKQRDKCDKIRAFSDWKSAHSDAKREAFAGNLAQKHYENKCRQKAWSAWHSVIENDWRDRVEKACQGRATEVCVQLSKDYDEQITKLNADLEAARAEIKRMHGDRDRYEDTMKKAFMRGVCALNIEAMTMFHDQDKNADLVQTLQKLGVETAADMNNVTITSQPRNEPLGPITIPQEPLYTTHPTPAPAARVVAAPIPNITTTSKYTCQGRGQTQMKSVTTKVAARPPTTLGGNVPLAPPMSSVIVERHQGVVKETIGHAMASKYPAKQANQVPSKSPVLSRKRIAGQTGFVRQSTVPTVKVVD